MAANPEEPQLDDVRTLSDDDLTSLVNDLLEADGATIHSRQSDHLVVEANGAQKLVVIRGSGRLALPTWFAEAIRLGVPEVSIVSTRTFDTEQESSLGAAGEMLTGSHESPPKVSVIDGDLLVAWLSQHPDVVRKYFPSDADVQQLAARTELPVTLLRTAGTLAPARPAQRTTSMGFAHLALVVVALGVVIATPIHVASHTATVVGAAGVATVCLALVGAAFLSARFDSRVDWIHARLVDIVLPVPDKSAIYRRASVGPRLTTRQLLGAVILMVPLQALRLAIRSGVLLFFGFFTLLFMLIWGSDSAVCAVGTTNCMGAFAGAGKAPSVGDFTYLAVQGGFFNQPADVMPVSRIARAALSGEFLAAGALLVGFAAAFGLHENLFKRGSD